MSFFAQRPPGRVDTQQREAEVKDEVANISERIALELKERMVKEGKKEALKVHFKGVMKERGDFNLSASELVRALREQGKPLVLSRSCKRILAERAGAAAAASIRASPSPFSP